LRDCKDIQFDIEPRQGSVTRKNRNSLINDLKSILVYQKPVEGYDYFLMLDSDIEFNLSNIEALINHNKDIVCSPYLMHGREGIYDCGEFLIQGSIKGRYNEDKKGLHVVDWIGAGFMLMKASVFEKMEYPWYRNILVRSGDNQEESSEDIGFCVNAERSNIDVWCDFDNPVGHKKRTHESFDWSF